MFPYAEFELFLGNDFSHIYDWFDITLIEGLTKAEAVHMQNTKHKIHSYVNYHPNDVHKDCSYKPYLYLNIDMLNDLDICQSSLIIYGATLRLASIISEGCELYKQIDFAQSIAETIQDDLNFPKVYMKI